MLPQDALRDLLSGLQPIFAGDGTASGPMAAQALCAAVDRLARTSLPLRPGPADWSRVLKLAAHPLAVAAGAAAPILNWAHAGLEDAKIPAAVARSMLTAELVGPDGLLPDPDHRIGLFFQAEAVDYPIRSHAAEEVYVMLAGEGQWSLDHAPHVARRAGDVLVHPSFAPHASRTCTEPFLAAWRWAGDISWQSYRCVGASTAA